jgi:hypothetical protein
LKSMLTRRAGVIVGTVAVMVLVAVGCHSQRAGQDVAFETSGSPATISWMVVRDDANYPSVNPSFPVDGIKHIYNDANDNCGGTWGTVGSGHTSPPDSTKVNCFMDEVNDDPNVSGDHQSIVCDDTGTANDCDTTDGNSNTAAPNQLATTYYQYGIAGTYARAERTLEWVRDWQAVTVTELNHTDYPDCLVINHTFSSADALPSAHIICPQ